MIKLLVGGKGTGKSQQLIDMANESVKTTDGFIVYIDNDNRHIFDLHYDIRFVDTTEFPMQNYREFIGFVYGILSQNHDIVEVYVDSLTNIISDFTYEDLKELRTKLQPLTNKGIHFVLSMSEDPGDVPVEFDDILIKS